MNFEFIFVQIARRMHADGYIKQVDYGSINNAADEIRQVITLAMANSHNPMAYDSILKSDYYFDAHIVIPSDSVDEIVQKILATIATSSGDKIDSFLDHCTELDPYIASVNMHTRHYSEISRLYKKDAIEMVEIITDEANNQIIHVVIGRRGIIPYFESDANSVFDAMRRHLMPTELIRRPKHEQKTKYLTDIFMSNLKQELASYIGS